MSNRTSTATSTTHPKSSTMSTRSKARLAAASLKKVVPAEPTQTEQKPPIRYHKSKSAEKENDEGIAPKLPAPKKKALRSSGPVYCNCQKGDDGSPMVHCEECKIWCVGTLIIRSSPVAICAKRLPSRYHFICVDLTEEGAEEISESWFTGPHTELIYPRSLQMYISVLHVPRRQAVEQPVSTWVPFHMYQIAFCSPRNL